MKSPTHSNINKINLDEAGQAGISTNNGTRSPPRANAVRGVIDDQISNLIVAFLDNEINEMAEIEMLLARIKQFEHIKIPFAGSSESANNSNAKSNHKKNVLVKKKYQILSSVTIDLINNTSTTQGISSSDRSKSRK